VKLAKVNSESAGKDRTERLRRDRMVAQVLRVAHPNVQQVRLELKFKATGTITPAVQSHVMHPPARAFFLFPCPYADCGGSFNLTSAVGAALENPHHHAEGTMECSGLRSVSFSVKQPCGLQLIYSIDATYHPK
jgi:hypothetical protein